MTDVFLSAGVRTPFVKAGGVYARHSALELSIPVVQRMRAQARPDLLVWGQVIPDPTISNIARELVFEAGLEPTIPAYSTVLACSTSFMATLQAAGLIGRGGTDLALVGGVESMSHVAIALKSAVAERLLKAMREARPVNVRQFFALANQHMRWELNDLARRLDD